MCNGVSASTSENTAEEDFRRVRPLHEAFTHKLKTLVEDLLRDAGIEYAQIEARTKTVESFVSKIQRKGERYSDPIADVTDLTGLRVIAYYREDVPVICELLTKEFGIDEANSRDASEHLSDDRFGYLSVHYVAEVSQSRSVLSEWKRFEGLRAEFQVRSVMQHAWSALDHRLRYKTADDVPRELRRQLFALSALLELADKEFSDLRRATAELVAEQKAEVARGELDQELDASSLAAYLAASGRDDWLVELSRDVGIEQKTLSEAGYNQSRSIMLSVFRDHQITRIEQLDAMLRRADGTALPLLKRVYEHCTAAGYDDEEADNLDLISVLMAVDLKAPDMISELGFYDYYSEAVAAAMAE